MDLQLKYQNLFYDYNSASSEIVVVAIDEKSLKEASLGPLPQWKREYYARVVENLNAQNVAAIGIDVTFPNKSIHGSEDESELATVLNKADNVVLASRYYYEGGEREFEWANEELEAANPNYGLINVQQDEDGFVRYIPLFSQTEKGLIEAFSLAISRIYLFAEPVDYRIVGDRFHYSDDITIPVTTRRDSESGERVDMMYVNYFARPNSFTRISFVDAYNGNFKSSKGRAVDLTDKIVLIGPTAIDLQDDYLSPVSQGIRMPGVEVHANNIQTIIEQEFLQDQSALSLWLILSSIIAINILLFSLLKLRYSIPLAIFEIFAVPIAGIIAYEYQVILNIVYPELAILLSFIGTYLLRFILEQKEKRFIEGAFGHYVNPSVVKQIEKDPKMLELGGAKRRLSVFFSDIANFTSISEKMSPEELVTFLNEYLGAMTDIILKHQGTLDKYEGDAIMAFWNAPLPLHNHELQACQSALEMQEKLKELRLKWIKEGKPEMHVRMGIHSGEAVVGNMGSKDRFDFTAMGDNVNLASRLEGINKQYGTYVCLSQSTYESVKDQMICRELDLIRVKGKEEAVRIYELLGRKEAMNQQLGLKLKIFGEALELYRKRNFEEAKKQFESIPSDPPSEVFIKRCDALMKEGVAEDWDGVWNFTTK
jgi:adenylate cyclase